MPSPTKAKFVPQVYGALPPEARRAQAALFNGQGGADRESAAARAPARVLVATDAVGMGLNLGIRRVVFTSLHKFNGQDLRQLSVGPPRVPDCPLVVTDWLTV